MHESANKPFTSSDLSYINLAVAALPPRFTDSTVGQAGPLRLAAAVAQLVDELGLASKVSSFGQLDSKQHEHFVDAALTQLKLYGAPSLRGGANCFRLVRQAATNARRARGDDGLAVVCSVVYSRT